MWPSTLCSLLLVQSTVTLHGFSLMEEQKATSSLRHSQESIPFPFIPAPPFPSFFLTAPPPLLLTTLPSPLNATHTPAPSAQSYTTSRNTILFWASPGSLTSIPPLTGKTTTSISNIMAAMSFGPVVGSNQQPSPHAPMAFS